jgi:hypothetical protein
MEPGNRLTGRERLLRIAGGIGLAAAGCALFAYSKANDPENRAAILAILAVLIGSSWIGHGIRGRRDSIVHHEEPPPAGPPVSPERTVAGILGAWLVPGLGHWIIGRRAKALLYFGAITATFLAGTALAQGRNLSFEREPVYFAAYMFNAGQTVVGWLLTRHLELTHRIPFLQLGLTYTAVACLLNVVAMMDFVSTCGRTAAATEGGSGTKPDSAGGPAGGQGPAGTPAGGPA